VWGFCVGEETNVTTETETTSRSPARIRCCPVCNHIERKTLDVALAIGYSPRKLSRKFMALTRKQIDQHRDVCLEGDPLGRLAERLGYTLVDDPEVDDPEAGGEG
jgi:hypothetical protein